ncbi:hypothetical protein D3C76_1386140 [compost metagenome]
MGIRLTEKERAACLRFPPRHSVQARPCCCRLMTSAIFTLREARANGNGLSGLMDSFLHRGPSAGFGLWGSGSTP